MTSKLKEQLLSKWADHVEYGYEPDTREFGESLIDIICSQREALEEILKQGPMDCADEWPQITAGDALHDTDARLKSMGVL